MKRSNVRYPRIQGIGHLEQGARKGTLPKCIGRAWLWMTAVLMIAIRRLG